MSINNIGEIKTQNGYVREKIVTINQAMACNCGYRLAKLSSLYLKLNKYICSIPK